MNQFIEKFKERIIGYWDNFSDEQKNTLLKDILQYANADPAFFQKDFNEVKFDEEMNPLPVVFESLSQDTDNWGQFYVDILNKIFDKAKEVDKPFKILGYLMEFSCIEKDDRPFVQDIVDRLYKEIDSKNTDTRLAVISTLPSFLKNRAIRNKDQIIEALQQKLHDRNWKVRYITFKSLNAENLLAEGYKLSIKDKLFKMMFGEPVVF